MSNHGPRQMAEAAEAGLKYSVNQVMYNLISRGAESIVCADAAKRNVAVMGYMPLMQGLLTGKYDSPREIPPARMRTRHFAGTREGARHGGTGYEEIIFKLMAELKTAAVEYGTSPGAASLAWCLSRSEIACEVTGIRSAAQLESGLEALKLAANTKLMSFMDMLSRDLMLKMGDGIDYWESDENSRSR